MKLVLVSLVVLVIALFTFLLRSEVLVVPHFSFGAIGASFTELDPNTVVVQKSPKTSLTFLGDLMLARRVETIVAASGSASIFSRMPSVASTSYVVANFEGAIPVQHVKTPELTMSFSVNPTYLGAVQAWGVTHLGLANNHSYDKGKAAFHNTQREIVAHQMVPFGDQRIASTSLTIVTVGSSTVALVGVYAVNVTPDIEKLQTLLVSIPTTTLQIAYVHWGTEYAVVHNRAQEQLAQHLVDMGFDAVIGHHPHVVQDIGFYNGAPIFYSLGNFIFDQYFSTAVQEGLSVSMVPIGDIIAFVLDPFTSLDGRTKPRLMQATEKSDFLANLAKRSNSALAPDITNGLLVIPIPKVANP